MSQWRRIALEKVPSCKQEIGCSQSPTSMWLDLLFALERAYEVVPPNEIVLQQIYGYAFWCFDTKNEDLLQGVLRFFTHLPQHGNVRRDLPNRLSFAYFKNLEPAFRYSLGDAEFKKFKEEFLSNKDARERRRWEIAQRRNEKS